MKQTNYLLIVILSLLGSFTAMGANRTFSVASPDGKIAAEILLSESAGLTYQVKYDGTTVITSSALGIQTSGSNFTGSLTYLSDETKTIDETYSLPTGKTSAYHNHCTELTLQVSTNNGKEMQLIFRAYNDGVAYRYLLLGSGSTILTTETSEINVAHFETSWAMNYASAYEPLLPARNWAETSSVANNEFCAPILVKTANTYLLLTESANYGDYCTSKIKSGTASQNGKFYFAKVGMVNMALPAKTPWRTVFIGSLPTIVESTLTENLNPPTQQTSLSWIEPGVAAWDWAENDGGHSNNTFSTPKVFIDLAYKMGWKYFVLDEGWESGSYPLSLVTEYAKVRNIKPIIWTHQNRFQNDSQQIRTILQGWKDLGFVGMKVDFWEDDSQTMMEKYDKLLTVAGELQLLVDLHGCTKPSGTRRFYPHLLTSEAVYGGEMYFANQLSATHHITLALTRNVIGAMDYTPMEIIRNSDGLIRRQTSFGQQLALTVLYESGLQCIFEHPENILYISPIRSFLKDLPAAWDETKCLEASVENSVTIARRHGENWYVASITNNARTADIALDFLGDGNYTAQIFKDGTSRSEIALETQTVTKNSVLHIPLTAQGGATVRISRTPIEVPPTFVYEAENAIFSASVQVDNDEAGFASNHKFIGFLGNGATVSFTNINVDIAGKYDLGIYFISGENRNLYVRVNNGEKTLYPFKGNGGTWNSDGLALKTVQVALQAGANRIELGNDSGWAPNIDRITVSPSQTYSEPQSTGGDDEPSDKIKVACIGNSITQGIGTPSRGFGYPFALQDFLGDKYEVRNFGVSGFCMLRHANNPYWNTSEYQNALLWNPDIVIIKLGTNDTNDYNWNPYGNEFKGDYTDMVNSFKNLSSNPKIYVCKPVPIYPTNSFKANVLVNEMFPLITEIAAETNSTIIDLFTPFEGRTDLFADDLHPNVPGMRWLAYQIGKSIQSEIVIDETMVYSNVFAHDLSDEKVGVPTAGTGEDISALFDNDASTAVVLPFEAGVNFTVEIPALSKVTSYSLTPSDEGTGEKRSYSWVLEGKPSSTWYTLDQRSNIEFLSNETKWFTPSSSYADIRQCKSFRLTFSSNGRKPNIALREWQLFGSRTQAAMETAVTSNGGVTTGQYEGYPNEEIDKLTDRSATTKYCVVNKGTTFWMQYDSPTPVVVNRYKLTSANDNPDRDPVEWELQASNDGENWITLDFQTHQNFAARYSTLDYKFNNSTPYSHFRLQVNKILQDKGTTFQLAEWQLIEKDETALPHVFRNDYRIHSGKNQLFIQSQVDETSKYCVYNIAGQVVKQGSLPPASEINTACNSGVYLVAFTSSAGKSIVKTIVL